MLGIQNMLESKYVRLRQNDGLARLRLVVGKAWDLYSWRFQDYIQILLVILFNNMPLHVSRSVSIQL
jgi:hypothetical protein